MNSQLQLMLQQGLQAFQNGNFDGADSILRRIIQVEPKNLPALHVLGLIKASQHRYKEAAELLSKAARINPNDASIQYNLAKALVDCGSEKQSIPHHKKAVELAPNNPEAWLNYGKTLSSLNAHEEALRMYDRATSINTQYAEAFMNKGASLKELRRYKEAIVFADRALNINPHLAEAWFNKGVSLKQLKLFEEAVAHFGNALKINPKLDWLKGDLLHLKMKLSCWDDLRAELDDIIGCVGSKEKIVQPFVILGLMDNPLLQRQCAEIYAGQYPSNPALGSILKRQRGNKIRIGYFSADFHNHATGYLIAELFELQDKEKFELIGISFGPQDQDQMRERLAKSLDQFIEVGGNSDAEIAQLSRNLNIDIAVDLKGYTQESRPGIFSYRAAPIQVSYLGYPGTLGSQHMDYIIADRTLIPESAVQFYTEKVAYLPNSYQVNDRKRIISSAKFSRQELGLPQNGFVFCCFNNGYKILPSTFNSWMKILKAVDGSILWLLQDNAWSVKNLRKEAEKQGIDPLRLVFAGLMPLSDHLARHQQADLFLDTLPYNAHTTTSDALWAGLPVITLVGMSFAGRVAASLLSAIDLPELITSSQEGYETLAIELALNPKKLADIRLKLVNNRLTTSLFDTPLFTKNLEAAYIKMYERYQTGLLPDQIFVD